MKLWAFISKEDQGIVATITKFGATPMVTMSEKNRDRFLTDAELIAKATGRTIELHEYDVSTVIKEFKP